MQNLNKYIAKLLPWKKHVASTHPAVFLTYEVAEETARLVASFGTSDEHHEGIVYWAGIRTPLACVVTSVLAPDATTTWGSYRTSIGANAYIVKAINDLKLQMLGQVHGHPTDWVDHSDGDNTGAFMPYDGFYSIILPWYGQRGMLPLETCGIHRFEDGFFPRLANDELQEKFTVVPTAVDLRKVLKSSWEKN